MNFNERHNWAKRFSLISICFSVLAFISLLLKEFEIAFSFIGMSTGFLLVVVIVTIVTFIDIRKFYPKGKP